MPTTPEPRPYQELAEKLVTRECLHEHVMKPVKIRAGQCEQCIQLYVEQERNKHDIRDLLDAPALFQFGRFQLSSGKLSDFKLECEAIRPTEWHSLARIALPMLPPFHKVRSVPRGGNAWGAIFENYVQPGSGRVLYVDDVWTTGLSMMKARLGYDDRWHGLVLFARGPVPKNVTALFTLHEDLQ